MRLIEEKKYYIIIRDIYINKCDKTEDRLNMKEVLLLEKDIMLRFALSGEIDAKNCEEFFDEVMKIYGENKKNILFDCTSLEFLDSTSLGHLVKMYKQVSRDGNKIAFEGLNNNLKRLFRICALDKMMEIK